MEYQPRIVRTDWLSRITAVVSLLVAIGSLVYVAIPFQDETPQSVVQDLDSKIAEQIEAKASDIDQKLTESLNAQIKQFDQKMTARDQELVNGLNTFDQRSRQLLADIQERERSDRLDRETRFASTLEAIRQDDATSDRGDDAVAGEAEQATGHDEALLAVSESRFNVEGADPTLVRIANNGTDVARISRIRFRPQSYFKRQQQNEASAFPGDVLTVVFDASDNMSTKEGHHGLYDRRLSEPIVIPPGGSQWLRLMIDSTSHVNWGLAGELALDYNGQSPLYFDSARVFLGSPTGS